MCFNIVLANLQQRSELAVIVQISLRWIDGHHIAHLSVLKESLLSLALEILRHQAGLFNVNAILEHLTLSILLCQNAAYDVAIGIRIEVFMMSCLTGEVVHLLLHLLIGDFNIIIRQMIVGRQ